MKQLLVILVHFPAADGEEKEKVKRAGECCKKILNHVNQAVKEAENKQVKSKTGRVGTTCPSTHRTSDDMFVQRLEEYQRRLDMSSLKQIENPLILELKVRNYFISLMF